MNHLALIPIQLDALFLRTEKSVVEATADLSRLPYFDKATGRDVNPNFAYLSEEVVSEPFQDNDLRLKPGIHLHWSLPDALTKSIGFPTLNKAEILDLIPSGGALWQELLDKNWIKPINGRLASILPAELRNGELFSDYQPYLSKLLPLLSRPQGTVFPAVPNRWLISRSLGGRLEKQWVVESDYLYPEGKGALSGSITYPFLQDWDENSSQPFRFLGRKLPLDVWLGQDGPSDARYLDDIDRHYLSAVGYGEPTFAAFYPNCHSVFGLHDDDYREDYPHDLQYELIGWYAQADHDFLKVFLQDLENKYTGRPEDLTAAKWQALQAELKWTTDPAQQINAPGALICFAHITFYPEVTPPANEHPDPASLTRITVGNTATEALSAFLAKEIAPGQKHLVEDQLESLLLANHLDHRTLDVGAKFYEARHEKGFNAVSGGVKWTIKLEISTEPGAKPEEKALLDLPEPLARQLDRLNGLQGSYDQKQATIVALRRQLFSDWYKYQLSCYPPEGSRDPELDVDLIKYFMEEKGIRQIREMEKVCGQLLVEKDETGRPVSARALDDQPGSLSGQVAGAVSGLLAAIAAFNALDSTRMAKQQAVLKTEAGSYFWQPKEPVVLITGDQVEATDRHGQDGRLHPEGFLSAYLLPAIDEHADGSRLLYGQQHSIREFIQTLKKKADAGSPGFRRWDGNPWHPLLLEWEVEVFPKKLGLNLYGAEGNYAPGFITDNYSLELNQPDLDGKVSEDTVIRSAQLYRGRSILTPQAGTQVMKQLDEHFEQGLKEEITRAFYKEANIAAGDRNDTWLETHFQDFISWTKGKAYNWQQLPAEPQPENGSLTGQWMQANIDVIRHWFVSENLVLTAYKKSDYYRIAPEQWDPLISWLRDRADLKKSFFITHNIPPEDQEDYLDQKPEVFLAWFKTIEEDLSYFYWENEVAVADQNAGYLQAQVGSLIQWYQAEVRTAYQLQVLSEAHRRLSRLNSLSQALSGFNDALLMHKLSLQVGVADPLGFAEDQAFAEKVKQAVGPYRDVAPQPWNDFAPIRTGLMKIQHLRLIDTFGQSRELIEKGAFLYGPAINTSEPLDGPNNQLLLSLPPRLTQPARLNFRWLAAADDVQEMNDHPASSPIFGWLLANHLDQSVMVYDQSGQAIGSVTLDGDQVWQPAPGQAFPALPDGIANPHLRQVVRYLLDNQERSLQEGVLPEDSFLWHFISAIDSAVEHIDPESFGRHQDLALLMGRPLALTRVSLGFELLGTPAVHQGWNAFRQDLRHRRRLTDGFEEVMFPIRIGEHWQLNDGLVGYWMEQGERFRDELFYAPQSTPINDPHIHTHLNGPMLLVQRIDDDDQYLTLLLDPRGKVHATCGVLPVKEISIPPEQYSEALSNIEVTFLTAPLLTSQHHLDLTLPQEAGFNWSWMERDAEGAWKTILNVETIDRATFFEKIPVSRARQLWELLLTPDIQWLQAVPDRDDLAIIVPIEQRKVTVLPNAALGTQVQEIFDYYGLGIKAFDGQAGFSGRQRIVEGWLKLQATTDAE